MAYATTSWQPDDEVTSEKLQQMSDNDTWLHDNALTANILYEYTTPATANDLRGRTPGTTGANKVVGMFASFDWNIDVVETAFVVNFPFAFAQAPICVVTVSTGTQPIFAYIKDDTHVDYLYVGLRYIDNAPHQFDGVLHIIAVGNV